MKYSYLKYVLFNVSGKDEFCWRCCFKIIFSTNLENVNNTGVARYSECSLFRRFSILSRRFDIPLVRKLKWAFGLTNFVSFSDYRTFGITNLRSIRTFGITTLWNNEPSEYKRAFRITSCNQI